MRNFAKSNPLFAIIFTVFVDVLGIGILIPVIPQLLANPQSEYFLLPKGMDLNGGYILLGYLTAIFPLMQFIAAPILGQLSDKYGRKPVLIISLIGTSLSYVVFAIGLFLRNLPLLFVSRGFDGITGGNISVAYAAIADITEPEHRAKNFGLIGAAFGIGFILGPFIGGKLSDPSIVSWFNVQTPFWFAAILSFANVVSVYFMFPETHKHKNLQFIIDWTKSIHNILKAFSLRQLRPLFITIFLYTAGFTFFTTFFGVFLIERFGFTQGQIGDFFAYVGLWIAFTQAIVTRYVAKKFKESDVLKFSMVGTGIAVFLYFLPTQWWQLLLITPFFAMMNGLTFANITALISRSADHTIQGEVMGINTSVQALGQAIPPILSGYIAASLVSSSPLIVAGTVVILSGLFFFAIYKPTKSI